MLWAGIRTQPLLDSMHAGPLPSSRVGSETRGSDSEMHGETQARKSSVCPVHTNKVLLCPPRTLWSQHSEWWRELFLHLLGVSGSSADSLCREGGRLEECVYEREEFGVCVCCVWYSVWRWVCFEVYLRTSE